MEIRLRNPIGIWRADGGKQGTDVWKVASDGEEAAADDGGIVMREMGY